jgi:LacI family transcriptional regulator
MARRPQVALMIETAGAYGRHLLQGITGYLRMHRPWSLFLERRELDSVPPRWLETWRGDGILSRWSSPHVVEQFSRIKSAAVDLSGRRGPFGPPRIHCDDLAIGRVAAEHLLQRGLRSFGFCGYDGELWSTRRREGFLGALARAGLRCQVCESSWHGLGAQHFEEDLKHIEAWLVSLPSPVGVMACNDMLGFQVLDGCRSAGLKVPEDVAVLGADDDALLCGLCDSPLSSVIPNTEQIGYEAAALLDLLMEGGRAGFKERLISPLGVATRMSTDVLAVEDTAFALAKRFIHEHACHGITVDDVLQGVPLSRMTLERRFRKYLGHSPHAEIRAVQLGRAKQLLAETEHPIHRIAQLVGFGHPEYFSVVFKREVGLSPGLFRKQAQSLGDPPNPTGGSDPKRRSGPPASGRKGRRRPGFTSASGTG